MTNGRQKEYSILLFYNYNEIAKILLSFSRHDETEVTVCQVNTSLFLISMEIVDESLS